MQKIFDTGGKITSLDEAEKVLLFDFSNLAFVGSFAKAYATLTTRDGRRSGHIFGCFKKLYACVNDLAAEKTALVFAFDEFAKHKKKLVPNYKAHRKPVEFDPRPDAKKMVRLLKCSTVVSKDQEADDTIATFCNKVREKEIVVVSNDKDLYQLLAFKHVKLFNLIKHEFVTKVDRNKYFGVNRWKKVVLWKALFGDPSDNIPVAVPRVRRNKVHPIINESDGSISDFYEVLEKYKGDFSEKALYAFSNGKKQVIKNYKIVKLNRKLPYDLDEYRGNRKKLTAFLKHFDCYSLVDQIGFLLGEQDG